MLEQRWLCDIGCKASGKSSMLLYQSSIGYATLAARHRAPCWLSSAQVNDGALMHSGMLTQRHPVDEHSMHPSEDSDLEAGEKHMPRSNGNSEPVIRLPPFSGIRGELTWQHRLRNGFHGMMSKQPARSHAWCNVRLESSCA